MKLLLLFYLQLRALLCLEQDAVSRLSEYVWPALSVSRSSVESETGSVAPWPGQSVKRRCPIERVGRTDSAGNALERPSAGRVPVGLSLGGWAGTQQVKHRGGSGMWAGVRPRDGM